MVKILLLGLSLAFVTGCSTPKKEIVYVSQPVACPVVRLDAFEEEIKSKEYTAKKVDDMICLTDKAFMDLVWHTTNSRESYNQLYYHVEEFNDLVGKRNDGL